MTTPGRSQFAAVFFLIVCLMITIACTDERGSPVGIFLIDDSFEGETPPDTVLYAVQDTSFEEVVNTSYSPVFYVGKEGKTRVRTLLRFEGLPQADSVLSAVVKLRRASEFTSSAFDVIAYPATAEWHVLDATWEIALIDEESGDTTKWDGGDYDLTEAGRFSFSGDEADTLFEMELDADLVESWIEDSDQNNGIILVSSEEESNPGFLSMVSRQSMDGVGEPTIELEYLSPENPDTILTTEILVNNDLFIYEYQDSDVRPEVPENLLLGAAPAFRTMLRFDLSGFDTTWTVIRADLSLYVADSTHLHEDLTVEAFAILSPWEGSDSEMDDTTLGITTVSPGDSTVGLNMTGMVQLWALGDFENHGFIVKMGRLQNVLGHVELYGADHNSLDRRPSMKIYYHIPDDPPFGPRAGGERREAVPAR